MNTKLHFSDIFVLKRLFFPNATQVIFIGNEEELSTYSEHNITQVSGVQEAISKIKNQEEPTAIFNFSKASLFEHFNEVSNLQGIINFTPDTKNGYTQSFSYINNTDSTMRWIYPTYSKSPVFINFYNNTGVKAKAFKSTAKALSKVMGLGLISNGTFTIDCNESYLPRGYAYAFFTGTIGQDRKAILASQVKGGNPEFTKMPIGGKSQDLVQNEYIKLQALQTAQFQHIEVPVATKTERGIKVTNVKPAHYTDATGLKDIHLKALNELYKQRTDVKKVTESSAWKTILEAMDFFETMPTLDNGLSTKKVNQLINYCKQAMYTLQDKEVVLGWAHGDFTPWNMYVTSNKLHLYDWELSKKDMPLLIDVFHYVFQKSILINHSSFTEINQELEDLMTNNKELKAILYKYDIEWNTHYTFYLLNIVCYYLPRYAQQAHLHDQANWLIDTWLEAMEALSTQTGVTQVSN